MKYLPNLRTAPWLVTSAVDLLGGQRPVIMGKGYLQQKSYSGSNYVEFDVDIGSSSIAKVSLQIHCKSMGGTLSSPSSRLSRQSVAGTVLGYCGSLVLDEAFVVEGKEEDELPERMLMQHEFRQVNIGECAKPLRPEDYDTDEVEAAAK